MKIFGWVIGCPKALFHCQHNLHYRTREETVHTGTCKVTHSVFHKEKKTSCCKCEWVSGWKPDESIVLR